MDYFQVKLTDGICLGYLLYLSLMLIETPGLSSLIFLRTLKLPLYPHTEVNKLSLSWEHPENLFLPVIVFLRVNYS